MMVLKNSIKEQADKKIIFVLMFFMFFLYVCFFFCSCKDNNGIENDENDERGTADHQNFYQSDTTETTLTEELHRTENITTRNLTTEMTEPTETTEVTEVTKATETIYAETEILTETETEENLRNIPTSPVSEDERYVSKRYIDPSKPMLALTFDDGPSSHTMEIVDKLVEYGGASTFFVVGINAEKRKKELKYIIDSGCEIGNHTWEHKSLVTLDEQGIDEAIGKVQETVFAAAGVYPTLIRPPYGAFNDFVKENVKFPLMMWTVDTNDWKYKDPKKIADYIMEKAGDGHVILMHDIYKTTKEAIIIAIPKLIEEGYQLVTLTELFQAKEKILENGMVYGGSK